MLRTVADDTPRPPAVTKSEDATGSPDAMYSRTSAANTRLDRWLSSMSRGQLYNAVRLKPDTTPPTLHQQHETVTYVVSGFSRTFIQPDFFLRLFQRIDRSAASRVPNFPCLTAMSSARMLTAISCGV